MNILAMQMRALLSITACEQSNNTPLAARELDTVVPNQRVAIVSQIQDDRVHLRLMQSHAHSKTRG